MSHSYLTGSYPFTVEHFYELRADTGFSLSTYNPLSFSTTKTKFSVLLNLTTELRLIINTSIKDCSEGKIIHFF